MVHVFSDAPTFNIALIGNQKAGKTSLIRSFLGLCFIEKTEQLPTPESLTKVVHFHGKTYLMTFIEYPFENLENMEKFPELFKEIHLFLVTVDVSAPIFPKQLGKLITFLHNVNEQAKIMLVGTKADLLDEESPMYGVLEELTYQLKCNAFLLTSTKTNFQIKELFALMLSLLPHKSC